MSLRRRLRDALRHRLVPSTAELDELRQRVKVRETELAEARQRIRSLERSLEQRDSKGEGVADKLRRSVSSPTAEQQTPAAQAPASGRTVEVVAEDCVGCGTCVELAPDAFQMDRAAAVAVVVSQAAPLDQVEEAISACPTVCIKWIEP